MYRYMYIVYFFFPAQYFIKSDEGASVAIVLWKLNYISGFPRYRENRKSPGIWFILFTVGKSP